MNEELAFPELLLMYRKFVTNVIFGIDIYFILACVMQISFASSENLLIAHWAMC